MRKTLPIALVLLSVALLVTGCDFFRAVAGRPTSKDIEAKREVIRQAEDEARRGSPVEPGMTETAKVEPGMTETAKVEPGMTETEPTETKPGTTEVKTAVTETKPDVTEKKPGKKRFYVILGAFSSRDNAERYAGKLRGLGYEPEFFGFTEGRTAVGVGGTDDGQEAKDFMKELKRQDFCPEGVWILDRKRK